MAQKIYNDILADPSRYDSRLSGMARIFYAEIRSAIDEKGYVDVDDAFYAKLYHVSDRTIRKCRAELEKYNYIYQEYNKNRRRKIIKVKEYPQIEIYKKINKKHQQSQLWDIDVWC